MSEFVLLCITLCPFEVCNHLEEGEKAGCFAISVLQMYYYCKCSVDLPHGTVGWSAVCDCAISDHTHLILEKKYVKIVVIATMN